MLQGAENYAELVLPPPVDLEVRIVDAITGAPWPEPVEWYAMGSVVVSSASFWMRPQWPGGNSWDGLLRARPGTVEFVVNELTECGARRA
ncbi:MAG: hypothetical protein EXS13_04310 [Planctomycetes bacterium]|nr:hypothetical protein [Planctomycetota bacterium]